MLHVSTSAAAMRRWAAPITAATLVVVSVAHFYTNTHASLWHELAKRLYYLPIVAAAGFYGIRGGLLTAGLSSALYLPHAFGGLGMGAMSTTECAGEIIVFTGVGVLTGWLADRWREERNRYRAAASALAETCEELRTTTEQRVRLERLAAVGRIAGGVAHEIRTPLAGIVGCLEILESRRDKKADAEEFVHLARREMQRLQNVAAAFLEFAEPPPPARRQTALAPLVVRAIAQAGSRSGKAGLAIRLLEHSADQPVVVDPQQVEQALSNLLLEAEGLDDRCTGEVTVTVENEGGHARVILDYPGMPKLYAGIDSDTLFEPFRSTARGYGFALATARRLIENQNGTLDAVIDRGRLRFVVTLPADPMSNQHTGDTEQVPERSAGVRRVAAVASFLFGALATLPGLLAAQGTTTSSSEVVFRTQVDIVPIDVHVGDRTGRPVIGLSASDFAVIDEGRLKPVRLFSTEPSTPLAVVLLFDRSASMAGSPLEQARAAARRFISELRSPDRVEVIAFNNTSEVLFPLGMDYAKAAASLDAVTGTGSTGFYEAILVAENRLASAPAEYRRAVVVLTDGEDTTAHLDVDAVLEDVRRSGVLVYPLSFRFDEKGRTLPIRSVLVQLAMESGGRARSIRTAGDLPQAFQEIATELRSLYRLAIGVDADAGGRWHRLSVRVPGHDVIARARAGYYAPRLIGAALRWHERN